MGRKSVEQEAYKEKRAAGQAKNGDAVLADRKFFIRKGIGRVGARLVVPAYTKGK